MKTPSIIAAREFLQNEQAFRLGTLVTESPHPATLNFGQTAREDLPLALTMLQTVDDDIPPVAERVLADPDFAALVDAMTAALQRGGRIFFTGCGATGRLAILLESAWRRHWQAQAHGSAMADRVISVMAGGDYALIKSVEGFEDFQAFGRQQIREAGLASRDLVVAITEGGETSFVIGTAWEGLDRGAAVFLVYNNPTDLLRAHVTRSRDIIDAVGGRVIDLCTGPMAVSGSTRMQATTIELLVVGMALETALRRGPHQDHATGEEGMVDPASAAGEFRRLLASLRGLEATEAMLGQTRLESTTYREHGLVTYLADSFLLDVLTDTTERSPTFMLPPFRPLNDRQSPHSWAFVKHPLHDTEAAWSAMLARTPRGLTWGQSDYEALRAPTALCRQPPQLDNAAIHAFMIGNEGDPDRASVHPAVTGIIIGGAEHPPLAPDQAFGTAAREDAACADTRFILQIGPAPVHADDGAEVFAIPYSAPPSPLDLWNHLALKLVLNNVSTLTMAALGRVEGNGMAWVSPSNKKLIDRGTRLVSSLGNVPYEEACLALFEALETVDVARTRGEEPEAPVSLAVRALNFPEARMI